MWNSRMVVVRRSESWVNVGQWRQRPEIAGPAEGVRWAWGFGGGGLIVTGGGRKVVATGEVESGGW
jgi:hypothetical protein